MHTTETDLHALRTAVDAAVREGVADQRAPLHSFRTYVRRTGAMAQSPDGVWIAIEGVAGAGQTFRAACENWLAQAQLTLTYGAAA